jgi:hypothetical protein
VRPHHRRRDALGQLADAAVERRLGGPGELGGIAESGERAPGERAGDLAPHPQRDDAEIEDAGGHPRRRAPPPRVELLVADRDRDRGVLDADRLRLGLAALLELQAQRLALPGGGREEVEGPLEIDLVADVVQPVQYHGADDARLRGLLYCALRDQGGTTPLLRA